MPDELSYEAAIGVLRSALVEVTANARAFAVRARGRPLRLTQRDWAELADIETLLARLIEETLRLELRAEPWGPIGQALAFWRGLLGGLRGEPGYLATQLRAARAHPVEGWRAGAPQLESSLWPFFSQRTRYLANTLALALNEPAPHPPLIWHPGERRFKE